MDYEYLERIRENHAGLRLLRADYMPLIASFLWSAFVDGNTRQWDEDSLAGQLEDHCFELHRDLPAKKARDFLRAWVEDGYLRQFYSDLDDVPRYELTASADKVLHWLHSLRGHAFVGTESRLVTILEVLRVLVEGAETDQQRRLEILLTERGKLDRDIELLRQGSFAVLDSTQIKERFNQLEGLARELIRDFSEVEQNFRDLDRNAREQIMRFEGNRGRVLDMVFQSADVIRESEQGRSFAAFFEFLMAPDRQAELERMLACVYELEDVRALHPDPFLSRLQAALLDGSERAMATQSRLSSQLRRFLDDRSRLEHRRIAGLIRSVESQFLDLRDGDRAEFEATLLDTKVSIDVPARSLYRVPLPLKKLMNLEAGDDREGEAGALFSQEYVDELELSRRIRRCLESESRISLKEIVERFPLRLGVAELVGYLKIASRSKSASIDSSLEEAIEIASDERRREVRLPLITFFK